MGFLLLFSIAASASELTVNGLAEDGEIPTLLKSQPLVRGIVLSVFGGFCLLQLLLYSVSTHHALLSESIALFVYSYLCCAVACPLGCLTVCIGFFFAEAGNFIVCQIYLLK